MFRRLPPVVWAALAAGGLALALAFAWRGAAGPSELTVLAVGDSTTVLGGEAAWPRVLEAALRARCPARPLRVVSFGVSGGDSADAAARIGAGLAIFRPAAVITMLGAHDTGAVPPPDAADLALFGAAYPSVDRMQDAILRHVLEREPLDDRRFEFRYLRPFVDLHLQELALGYARTVLARWPSHRWAAFQAGELEVSLENLAEARRWHQRAAELDASRGPVREPRFLVAQLRDLLPDLAAYRARYLALRGGLTDPRELDLAAAEVFRLAGLARDEEEALRHLLAAASADRRALAELRACLSRQGREREARALPPLPPFAWPEGTRRNYLAVAGAVRAGGAALFPMEYPGRDPGALRELTGALAEAVIENRAAFAAAAAEGGYERFFRDRFAGDFGVFQPLSHRLVAESAAAVLGPWLERKGECRHGS